MKSKIINFEVPKVSSTKVKMNEKSLIINLPVGMAKYLGLSAKNDLIFFCGINGGLQITTTPAALGIPSLSNIEEFESQSDSV